MSEEHFTDGWEPDLPVWDTLLRRFLFNLAAFNELPAAAAGARTLRRDDFTAADLGRPAAMHNAATLLRPLPFDRPGDTLDEGGQPVCVGSLFVDFGLATFSLGVTLPEARRRGYWAAMAGVRLLEEPGLPAVGVFSDLSRPSAEALGFLPITRFTLWHRPRPAR